MIFIVFQGNLFCLFRPNLASRLNLAFIFGVASQRALFQSHFLFFDFLVNFGHFSNSGHFKGFTLKMATI